MPNETVEPRLWSRPEVKTVAISIASRISEKIGLQGAIVEISFLSGDLHCPYFVMSFFGSNGYPLFDLTIYWRGDQWFARSTSSMDSILAACCDVL